MWRGLEHRQIFSSIYHLNGTVEDLFECDTDKFLMNALGRVEDDFPIGESTWILINPNQTVLELTSSRIKKCLPHANVKAILSDFNRWIESGLSEYSRMWSNYLINILV